MNRPVDWKAFEYKFSIDSRPAFESLAYILFCYEFKQTYGIFRYYNQPYIETQPANTADGHKVGFQAKYYDAGTQMSSKEQDLKDAIKGAKNKYAGIDRIIFYINKEFSASSAKDKDKPQYQLYIEKYGADLGIEIQWRGQSHIEKMLAEEELKYVKNLYFNAKDGIDRFHENLINHKNSILKHIHSTIQYTGKEVKIPQDYQKLTDFQESDTQVMIIHGAAGAGKSATVKDFLEAEKNQKEKITLMFSASDLDVKEENLFLYDGNYGLQDLFGLYKNEEHRLCIIDSAEKYCTAKYPEVFGDILRQFLDHGWKVLITIRIFYKDTFCNTFLKKETLTQINNQYPFVLPADPKVQELLCNLFYLNLYLNMEHSSEDENMNVTLFRDAIWNQVIRNDFQQYNNLPVKREAFVQQMVSDMMAHERYTYSLKATDDFETVSALESSGIIIPYQENRKNWMMSHDVYEEIVTNHIFTEHLEQDTCSEKTFFADLGNSLRSRKSYRIWLESQLSDGENWILQFLLDLFDDEELGREWKDETLIALMNSESEEGYFIRDTLLSQSGQELFTRMMFLLNTACRGGMDPEMLKLINNGQKGILGFIEDSRSNRFNINQDTLNLLRSLFITRKADVNAEKPIFSTLIMKLREEHRTSFDGSYDSSTDAIVRIFNKLVEVYPEEPHFTAHLARFYFYIDKNYEKGFRNIDSAIELSETEMGHVDPLLYHMKAMGYSSRITNIYRRDILWNFKDNSQYDTSELREKIQEDAESAFKYFKIVRDSNIGVAGHVSEINLCIQIAYLAKNMLDETDNFTEYLTSDKGKWAMQYIDRAETLWDECKQLISDSAYEDLDGIEERLHSLTVSVEDSIDIWKKYIENAGNKNCTQARRILARSYLKVAEQTKDSENKKTLYTKVIQLMEENISEENQHVGNIRIWFDSIKRIEVENQDMLIQDAIIKLNRWVNLTDSVDAHYYRFILKFIQAIEGSTLAEGELPKLLRELKHTAANKYNRTVPQHWLSKNGKGINALITNNRNRRNAVPEDEMSEILLTFIGRISNNYVNDSHAYINWHGVDVYFNPSATKGEISKINIGQRVRFGLGFSYDGPRAYNSSIKLLGKDEFVEVKREIESGIAVKCEVTKNVTHYVQVRIIGFSEIGSIYVNELVEPYSANNRPDIGTILDGKILMKKFDNAKHCNVWQITMNMNDIKEESKEETAMAQAIRLSGIKVR